MTRAVLIDVDGVLVHSHFHPDPARRRRWDEHLLEDMGVEPAAFKTLFKGGFDAAITGEASLVETLDAFLPTVGYRGSTLDFIGYWLTHDAHLNFQLLDALQRLSETGGVRLYVATNQEHLRANHLWSNLGLCRVFDDMFYSARLGVAKPGADYFANVDALLGPQTEPPLIFDDSPAVIEAANGHGWEGVLFLTLDDFTGQPWVQTRMKP